MIGYRWFLFVLPFVCFGIVAVLYLNGRDTYVRKSIAEKVSENSEYIPEFEIKRPAEISEVRAIEMNRGPKDPHRKVIPFSNMPKFGFEYRRVQNDESIKESDIAKLKKTSRMPPTECTQIDFDIDLSNRRFPNAHKANAQENNLFQNWSGFGANRMAWENNSRGVVHAHHKIDRVELVGLLLHPEPIVYVIDEVPTPALAKHAATRPLDSFEVLSLDAVRQGAEIAWTTEAPRRMLGAIRAGSYCVECHSGAKEGDLLGAFSYYLECSIDQL